MRAGMFPLLHYIVRYTVVAEATVDNKTGIKIIALLMCFDSPRGS